jgi:hypothetical protein
MRHNFFLLPILLLAAGCATNTLSPPQYPSPSEKSFPANGFITQRALFTARGQQFALNGYLALSETSGKRLVITENFGHVVADALVKPDGKIFVMQSSRMFSEKYIRFGISKDLECIFGNANNGCPVKTPGTNHFLIQRHGYTLDLRIVEIKIGPQPLELFDETKAPKQ